MTTIQGETGGLKTAAIDKNYPYEDGLVGGTTTQEGHERFLLPEDGTVVNRVGKKGYQ